MTTTNRNDSTSFISGSTMEGAAYARHLAQQSMQDFDFMLIEGTITSPDCLIKLKEAEGFVQVKYNDKYIQQLSKTPFSTKQNHNGVLCINGFKMKEKYCGADSISFFPTSTFTTTGQTTVNSASTEVKFKSNSPTMSLGEQFENTLYSIRRIKAQENIQLLQPKYILACNTFLNTISQFVLPLLGTISDAEGFTLQTFQDLISLTFPIYNIQIPQVNKLRLNAVLDFYEKYKHLGNPLFLDDHIEYGQLCMNNEADFVPALQLTFWPDDIQLFLDRIKFHRPILYKIIYETSSMHLIPKWSTKTAEVDQELEFRYSFSAIECLLAKNRTQIEQILNGVARSIYYRYLKNQPSLEDNTKTLIPSYFVKTTVLWMCEIIDLNDQFTDTDNDQIIARIMAEKWIEYVIQLLSNGVCKHYFIDGLNLLESCSTESLAKVIDILQHQVNLDEDIKIEIWIEQNNLINKQRQTTEDWIGNLKKKDILNAINDYKSLRENWLCPTTDVQDEGDAIGCLYTLNQLRTLDGHDQQNWKTFKRLFLDTDETDWLPPLWDEQVGNCSVCDFTDNLSALGSMLNNIQIIMEKEDFDGSITTDFNQHEFVGAQNILNNLITPSNMVSNGLMSSWLPMFLCSHFNALPTGISSNVLSSFQHRSIIADHPIGPLNNILQGRSLPSSMDSSTRQTFNQYSQHVSNNFLNLLNETSNDDMTLNDLIQYYDKSQLITETEKMSFLPKHTNSSLINKEQITLIIFDPNLNIKTIDDNIYRTINDYVLFYSTKSQLLTYVKSINEETIFIIIWDFLSDENFLSQLQNLNQVNSIYIYYVEQDNNYQLLMNKYSKIVGIYTEQTLLFEQIRINIEQQSILTFGFFDPKQIFPTYNKLSKENALFFWNLLLKDLLMNDDSIDKSLMIQKCREYYCQNSIELENIEQFEKTYESTNAYEWYLKHCFISKQLNKAFHKTDIEQLKLFNFFIRNLSSTIKSPSSIDKVYSTTTISINQFEMLLKNVGKLIIFNGFLVMNCSHTEPVPYRTDAHVAVIFEVVNACTSYVYSIDSNRVIFDLGITFQLDSFDFDENLQLWIARLIKTNNSTQIAQNYIITQQQKMEKTTLAIIMGELLLIMNDLSKTKIYFENLQNEDDALIYYYYGHIHYLKGEYDLALENFQISYELMISGERLKDSAFVLHDIGYVYDMKKEFNEANDNHQKALEIRQIYYPENDVHIGISFYNIGRTLVNMSDYDQALIYHEKALNIWEQTLTNDHSYIVRSLHSHGVTYFNKRDYTQATHYYTRALELYETTIPRDDHGILMIREALENIKDLSSRQSMTQ